MKIKFALLVFVLAVLIGGIAFYCCFGIYSVKNESGEPERIFVNKISKLKVGDLVAYRYPLQFDSKLNDRKVIVGRIVALPGSMLQIAGGSLYVNSNLVPEEQPIKVRCRISVDSAQNIDFYKFLENYDVKIEEVINDGKACNFVTTIAEFENIQNQGNALSACRIIIERNDWKDTNIFPSSAFFAWNKDNFGPIYLPTINDTLNFTPRLAPIYKNVISLFEGNDFESDTYHVRINQQEANQYVATKNYYFILNDDRTNILDCRSYGPIPEEYIIGTVL